MGLDMYAYTINQNLVENEPETDVEVTGIALANAGMKLSELTPEEYEKMTDAQWEERRITREACYVIAKAAYGFDPDFAYWRKFNALHGWMRDLYERKGGKDPEFNCNTVRLMPEDVAELEQAAMSKTLAPVPGFFFGGQDEFSDEDRDDVLAFCAKCRVAFDSGKAVFYNSWW